MDIAIHVFLLSVFIGFVLGIVSGLTPGIHTNNIAVLLLGASPLLGAYGFPPVYIAVMILSNSIAHTFLDIIPSVFLGAPEADTALAVLPGHRLLLEGRGAEAVRLSALGSALSVAASLVLVLPLAVFFMYAYDTVDAFIGWILILIVVFMIMTETGEYVTGQGSLAHWKYRAAALVVFAISGVLGIIAFDSQHMMAPLIGVEASALLPLLSGLFGASTLIISLMTGASVPQQKKCEGLIFERRMLVRGVGAGSVAGSFVAWLPGVSSSVATLIARLVMREKKEEREFLVALSGANTSNAIFSIVALFIIDRARSGAVVAVESLVKSRDMEVMLLFFIAVVLTALISYFATVYIGDRAAPLLAKLDYRKLCAAALIGLTAIVLVSTGAPGLAVFIASTGIGMMPTFLGVRKTHLMGVIMVPVILYFM